MKAIILAAGKGVRMGELTNNCPKPLLTIEGKNLIEWKIDNLPNDINEVIIVVGYLKEKIISYFGDNYKGKKISYVEAEPHGTGYAVWKCKDLAGDRFIVLMGDDLYSKEAIQKAVDNPFSLIAKRYDVSRKNIIEINENGYFCGIDDTNIGIGLVNTGLYSLSKEVFDFELIKVPGTEEWGLPHTLVEVGKKTPIKIIETDYWYQITSPEDLKVSEDLLKLFR